MINIHKAEPNTPPTEPKPAATVMLIRPAKAGLEVLMILRNKNANFGGAWVFPGGKVETYDNQIVSQNFSAGITDSMASEIMGLSSGGLNYWVACVRECFEECGILMAYRKSGELFGRASYREQEVLNRYRNDLNAGNSVLLDLCRQLNVKLAVDRMAYVSHWITPISEAKRYSTRFFLAVAPRYQQAFHDGSESVNSIWIRPEEALQKALKEDFPLLMPTKKNLESIVGYRDIEELLYVKAAKQKKVETIQPELKYKNSKLV
ncbi:MAG: NUDIX hydrolase [Proteobacteria bacterium]|nr:NUDIX hydrolase [Pseudomonadota bacterium]